MQFLVQSQAADFKRPDVSLPWRDFANGEILDNRLSMPLRRSRSKAALIDPERADARFKC
jgi:hypothetical protein